MWKEYPKNNNYLVSCDGQIKSKYYNKLLIPKITGMVIIESKYGTKENVK